MGIIKKVNSSFILYAFPAISFYPLISIKKLLKSIKIWNDHPGNPLLSTSHHEGSHLRGSTGAGYTSCRIETHILKKTPLSLCAPHNNSYKTI